MKREARGIKGGSGEKRVSNRETRATEDGKERREASRAKQDGQGGGGRSVGEYERKRGGEKRAESGSESGVSDLSPEPIKWTSRGTDGAIRFTGHETP